MVWPKGGDLTYSARELDDFQWRSGARHAGTAMSYLASTLDSPDQRTPPLIEERFVAQSSPRTVEVVP
jgi:hypothetical protein